MLRLDAVRLRRVRRALDEFGYDAIQRGLRGGFPRVPFPPYVEFSSTLRIVEPRLRTWFRLLMLGRRLPAPEVQAALGAELVRDLVRLGLVRERAGRMDTGGLGLVSYHDRYLVASLDPTYPTAIDRRQTVYVGGPSYHLAGQLPVGKQYGSALDLCAGSGLLGILMAPRSRRVVCAELLPEAVNAARFNVALNGLEDRVEVVQGSLYEPVAQKRFDLIVVNAPFVPLPADLGGAAFADGGPDGMRLLGPILEELSDHLTARGEAMLYVQGMGGPSAPFFATRLADIASRRSLEGRLLLQDRTSIAETLRTWGEVAAHGTGWAARKGRLRAHFKTNGASAYYTMLATLRRGRDGVKIVDAVPWRKRTK